MIDRLLNLTLAVRDLLPERDPGKKQPTALRLADALESGWCAAESEGEMRQAAVELRRLHEEIETLKQCLFQAQEAAKTLATDPGNRYAHRLAIELECALLAPEQASANLLDEYHTAVREWMEANGQPYVSGFGKD